MKVLQTNSYIAIGGTQVPVIKWDTTLSASGQIATVNAETSLALCNFFNIDIIALGEVGDGATFDVYVGYGGKLKHIFGGVLDQCRWKLGNDKIEIKALDYGCVLLDTIATTASLGKIKNQSIGQIVQQIADATSFKSNITDPGISAGFVVNGESTYAPHPQPYWNIIGNLAEQCGYEYYVTPDKTLYFGPQQTNGSMTVDWGPPALSDTANPLIDCEVLWQPRDNSNFQVKVISHNPDTGKHVSHVYDNSGKKLRKKKSKKIKQSEIIGTSNGSKTSVSGGTGKPSKKPVFVYRMDGLTPEQCAAKAESIGKDLAKRLVILEADMPGNPDIQVHTEVTLDQGALDCSGFDSLVYDVVEVKHTYQAPQGFGGGGGWFTHFKALAKLDS